MRSKAQLRKELEKAKSSFTPDELFSSPYLGEMLFATIESVCTRLGRIPKLLVSYDPSCDDIAYTNGSMVYVNSGARTVRSLETDWEKYVCLIGHTTHEAGHLLFTNFRSQGEMIRCWEMGKPLFYTGLPNVPNALETQDFILSHPGYRKMAYEIMKDVTNAIEDAYIENRLFEIFDGLCAAGLVIGNRCIEKQFSLKSLCKGLMEDPFPVCEAANYVLVKYKLGKSFDTSLLTEEEKEAFSGFEKIMDSANSEFTELVTEQNGTRRCILLNSIYVKLISTLVSQNPESSEENSQENGEGETKEPQDLSTKEVETILEQMKEKSLSESVGKEPTGNTDGIRLPGKPDQTENRKNGENLCESPASLNRELQSALKDACRKAVYEKDEKEHEKELNRELSEFLREGNFPNVHFEGYQLNRPKPDPAAYHCRFDKERKTAKNLSRRLSNVLKCRNPGGMENGFLMGQKFCPENLKNHNGKYFSRLISPDGSPSVAFGILVDESGSMDGDNTEKARKTAVILEDALRTLGVPLFVVGHTTSFNGDNCCILNVYADFDTFDGQDRFRLAEIGSYYCNIDGAAITYLSEKLLKRPERQKVLIVISDGFPTGSSFYSEDPLEDTKDAIEKYRKKGIRIFGAVLEDFDNIGAIYGKQYAFNCQSGETLQTELCKIVKRYVLN